MGFDTAFGGVKGYLAELHGRGVDLHLVRNEHHLKGGSLGRRPCRAKD
jgi:hypothetical protein